MMCSLQSSIKSERDMATEKRSILVVEDEAKLRRLIELQLADEGFLVQSAPDAETGLKIVQRNWFSDPPRLPIAGDERAGISAGGETDRCADAGCRP